MSLKKNISNIQRSVLIKRDQKRFQQEYYKKSALTYPPRYLTVAISSACTFKCVFCAYHSDDAKNGASNAYGLHYRLSIKDFQRIIDMCYAGRVPRIHICATGETFLHPDILQIIDYAIEVYGTMSIQTDFFRSIFEKHNYLDEIIQRKDFISYITTDVLSGDPKVHERVKRGSRYEDVLSSMEYINRYSNIHFEVHYIITKHNYQHIDWLINDLARRRINCHVAIVNLHPHGFNEFTSLNSVYTSKDVEITSALKKAQVLGREKEISVSIPQPFDSRDGRCGSFWTRLQTWPVKGIDKNRYGENVIIGGCNAVVKGKLNTLGYIFDYGNIMELWNNEYLVKIREDLLKGVYPDNECRYCQNYKYAEIGNDDAVVSL